MGVERNAKVTMAQTGEKMKILSSKRFIEMKLFDQAFPVRGRGIFSQHDIDRVSGDQMNQEKDQADDAENNRD